ncbi:MAG: hypothetical protein LCH36_05565 [Actinobacteria bacterium]|nr:hypothetical protein [Actinomycetota bacterium]
MAAVLFTILIALLAAFQLALAAGAPLGSFAWGGAYPGKLPLARRVGSVVSVVLYAFFAVVVLDRSGVTQLLPEGFSRVGIWVVFGILVLSTVGNLFSRSLQERIAMTPTAALLSVLALVVALQP